MTPPSPIGKKRAALRLFCLFVIAFLLLFKGVCPAGQINDKSKEKPGHGLTGSEIMDQVFKRHRLFPYVYEEQTMVLTDNKGQKDIKKMRRFSRVETDGTLKYLLVFDTPKEIRGVALGILRDPKGMVQLHIYLPALGKQVSSDYLKNQGRDFLGTDFSIEDLMETVSDLIYTRKADQPMTKQKTGAYFVVEASSRDKKSNLTEGYKTRVHYIQQDNFFIVRTDFFDHGHRLIKRLTHHDLKRMDKNMWRGNMRLMENIRQGHTTLIKIDRRVLSQDYVPPEVFTLSWLQKKYPVQETNSNDTENAPASSKTDPEDRTNNRIGN